MNIVEFVLGISILCFMICILFVLLKIESHLAKLEAGDFLTRPINSYGEGIGDAIQGQLVRGQAGISQYE